MIDVIADRLPELGTVEVFLPPASSRDRRAGSCRSSLRRAPLCEGRLGVEGKLSPGS